MDQIQLKELKNDYSQFLMLYNKLKIAKNQKERNLIDNELDSLKSRMINNFKLRLQDKYLPHYSNDNYWFKNDVESIIDKLENDDLNP